MNILYTVNDAFISQAGASVCSICENNKKADNIHFFILSDGIAKKNCMELEKLAERYGRKISILEVGDIGRYFDFEYHIKGWNEIILVRLLMGSLLPAEVDRLIYLDADTIVRGSLLPLWNTEMGAKFVGMSCELTVDKQRKKALKLDGFLYHNSGVILVNLEQWRKQDIQGRLLRYYKRNGEQLFAHDQDLLNIVLRGKIHLIPLKYNYCNTYYLYQVRFLVKLAARQGIDARKIQKECKEDPVVIHYLGEERPWRKGNTHKYRDDYKKYRSLTYWRDVPYEDGWRIYFICWRIFNFMMRPVPKIRYSIINYFIPFVIRNRGGGNSGSVEE